MNRMAEADIWVIAREMEDRERMRGLLAVAGFDSRGCGTDGASLLTLRVSRPSLAVFCGQGLEEDQVKEGLARIRRGHGEYRIPVAFVSERGQFDNALRWLRRGLVEDIFSLPMAPEVLQERMYVLQTRFEGFQGFRDNLHSSFEVIGDLSRQLQAQEAMLRCDRRAGQAAYVGFIHAMVRALESKDSYTAFHSTRVAKLASRTGRRLGFSSQELKVLRRASLLHDIGKIGIDGGVINKKGVLNTNEWKKLRLHPELGGLILKPLTGLREEAILVQQHHERWDGNGYPSQLERNQLGLPAGVIAVCDAYDAMTSDRSYRKKMDRETALAEIREGREKQFHPAAVDAFIGIF